MEQLGSTTGGRRCGAKNSPNGRWRPCRPNRCCASRRGWFPRSGRWGRGSRISRRWGCDGRVAFRLLSMKGPGPRSSDPHRSRPPGTASGPDRTAEQPPPWRLHQRVTSAEAGEIAGVTTLVEFALSCDALQQQPVHHCDDTGLDMIRSSLLRSWTPAPSQQPRICPGPMPRTARGWRIRGSRSTETRRTGSPNRRASWRNGCADNIGQNRHYIWRGCRWILAASRTDTTR